MAGKKSLFEENWQQPRENISAWPIFRWSYYHVTPRTHMKRSSQGCRSRTDELFS
ncbi:unnamed protein product [Ixodes persulcatus]